MEKSVVIKYVVLNSVRHNIIERSSELDPKTTDSIITPKTTIQNWWNWNWLTEKAYVIREKLKLI